MSTLSNDAQHDFSFRWLHHRIDDDLFSLSDPIQISPRQSFKSAGSPLLQLLIHQQRGVPVPTSYWDLPTIHPDIISPQSEFGMRQLVMCETRENPPEFLRRLRWWLGRNIAYVFVWNDVEDGKPKILGYFNGLEHEPVYKDLDKFCDWKSHVYDPKTSGVPRVYLNLALGIDLGIGRQRVGQFAQVPLDDVLALKSTPPSNKDGSQPDKYSPRRWSSPDFKYALVTEQKDKPEQIANTASVLAGYGVNVCGCFVRRVRNADALLVFLTDKTIPKDAIKTLRSMEVRPRKWSWENPEDLDLSDRHGSIALDSIVLRFYSDDRPGRIARIARRLGEAGVNISAFLIARSCNRLRVEKASRSLYAPKLTQDEGSTILCFCDRERPKKEGDWWTGNIWNDLVTSFESDLQIEDCLRPDRLNPKSAFECFEMKAGRIVVP